MNEYKIIIGVIILIVFLVLFSKIIIKKIRFHKTDYKKVSGNSYSKTFNDKGNYGEYLIYNYLRKIKGEKRILANVYLPKENGTTTEVDLIMIHTSGIYVIESKNYSGWIYGHRDERMWLQTFNNGEKYKFYNPIFQNNNHVKILNRRLKSSYGDKIFSYIVFSEHCKFKRLKIRKVESRVIKVNKLLKYIRKDIRRNKYILQEDEVEKIYNELLQYSLLNRRAKKGHVKEIRKQYW